MDILWIFIGPYELMISVEPEFYIDEVLLIFYAWLQAIVEFAIEYDFIDEPWMVVILIDNCDDLEDEYYEYDDEIY